jgi:hypothetical protein
MLIIAMYNRLYVIKYIIQYNRIEYCDTMKLILQKQYSRMKLSFIIVKLYEPKFRLKLFIFSFIKENLLFSQNQFFKHSTKWVTQRKFLKVLKFILNFIVIFTLV